MTSVWRQDRLVAAMPAVFVLIWSTGFVVARFAMPQSPPMKFLAWRFFLSALCFIAWIAAARVKLPANGRQVTHLAIVGLLIQFGYLGGVWSAVKLGMGAGLASLLVGLQPVLTAYWISSRGGKVSARQWAGLALGFAGLALVVWEKLGIGEITGLNFSLAVGALLSITIGTLYQKRFVARCDVRAAGLVQMSAALLVTVPLALLETEPMRVNSELIGAMGWSVLAMTLGGSSLLYMLIQRGAATVVTSLMYLVPPCTAVMAWILFREPITAFTILGMALAAVGVSLVVRAPARPSAMPE
jgi:drug/metabolite transporter (DMT)-like permease